MAPNRPPQYLIWKLKLVTCLEATDASRTSRAEPTRLGLRAPAVRLTSLTFEIRTLHASYAAPSGPHPTYGPTRLTPEPAGARNGRWWPSLRLTAAEERQTGPEHHRALHERDVHGANSDTPRLRLPLPIVQRGHAGCPAAPHVAISLKVVDLASRARCTHATRTRLTVSMCYKAQRALG